MTSLALLFTLSAIGISETVYLIRKRKAAEKPVCFLGDDCHVVLESKYSHIFFVPNDILGFLSYLIISSAAGLLVIGAPLAALWLDTLKILVVAGAVFSIFLTYLQWRVIKAWCFWCLMSAFTIWLMLVIIIMSE